MMSSWAVGTMGRTCELLQAAYGDFSCRIEHHGVPVKGEEVTKGGKHEWDLVFEPHLASGDPSDRRCPCDNVKRVRITYSSRGKHRLPVESSCPWSHPNGIPSWTDGCKAIDNSEVKGYHDLRSCMQESRCEMEDDGLQFATVRDPRAVAVSTFFWTETHPEEVSVHAPDRIHRNQTLDDSILDILESVCLWTTTRYILFNEILQDRGTVFGYEEALVDPLEWHFRWTHLAGLHLPVAWVEDIAALATRGAWEGMTQGINAHPGGQEPAQRRTWRDEVSPELWEDMDAMVRRWLPGPLLAQIGVPPLPPPGGAHAH